MMKKILTTKTFIICTSIIIGIIIGYYFRINGFNNVITHSNFINIIIQKVHKFLLSVINFAPKPNFLSDIAAFEAVIIAIAIPLSLDIVSRISERYQSAVISKQFNNEWEIRLLPTFLIINIVVALLLKFFVGDNPQGLFWSISALITLLLFLAIAVIFIFKFLPKLKSYITEPEFIMDRFFNEAEKLFK